MINKSSKSKLAISLITAIIISSSFCLHLFVMTTMAAAEPEMAANPSKSGSVNVADQMPCCQDCATKSEQSIGQSPVASLNCCAGQTIYPTLISNNSEWSNHLITFFSSAADNNIISNSAPHLYYQTVILSPPQTVALRSIVKLE